MKSVNKITNCEFSFKCPKTWDALATTENQWIRFCSECEKGVYLAEDQETLGMLASIGKCVAIKQDVMTSGFDDFGESDYLVGLVEIPIQLVDEEEIQWEGEIDCSHNELRGVAPGFLLNNGESGSDGNFYTILRSTDGTYSWDLWRMVPKHMFAPGFDVYKIGEAISVETLYVQLESVDIFVQGHEAIALGLPFHGGNY